MNRKKAEKWLSLAYDGELSARRREKLGAHLARHPELVGLQQEWAVIGREFRQRIPQSRKTPEAAWQDVRRTVRLAAGRRRGAAAESSAHVQGRLRWAGALVGLLLVASVGWMWLRSPSPQSVAVARSDRTEVEWVETDLPDGMSMVYEDNETGLTVIWVSVDEEGEGREDERSG